MKVALLGLGYWGAKLLRNLVSVVGAERVVAIDPVASRQAQARDVHSGIQVGGSLDAALRDEDVRAVVVATPVASHARLAREALAAGRHVLVEKPLASSVPDAVDLARLAEERGLTLMAGHTYLFSPRVECVAACLRDGRLGRINYVTSSRLNLGIHRPDANVIWDLAPHDFSIILSLLNESPSTMQTTAHSLGSGRMPDVAFVNMTFPSGAIASVVVSWLAPRKVRSTVIVGERGMIVYDDTQPDEPVKIYDRGVVVPESASFGENQLTYRYGDTISPHVSADEPLTLELQHFIASIESKSRCRSDGWFGVEVVRALEAADRSWQRSGLPVDVTAPSSDAA